MTIVSNVVRLGLLAKTARRLGVRNVMHVMYYRLRTRAGTIVIQPAAPQSAEFFGPALPRPAPAARTSGPLTYFGWKTFDAVRRDPPDWFADPFTGKRIPADSPWSRVPDFGSSGIDIKCIWEISRWDWVLHFAQAFRQSGERAELERLNRWLHDWAVRNPPFDGPNWKSGQEAGIRLMHLAMAAVILGQEHSPSHAIAQLVRSHVRRIEATLQYAIAQDNNHGTSEAAGLFVGGSWLCSRGVDPEGERCMQIGRRWLEDRVARLIDADGGFSQHSTNYHRLLLDTLSMVEVWRRRMALPAFSPQWYARAASAARWLHAITDPVSGDAPNMGANDGARLLPLTDTDFRDYRPSVQLAMALFAAEAAYAAEGEWSAPMVWLDVPLPDKRSPAARSSHFDQGGYAVLRRARAMALMRYPRFRFRPSHADALHVDLWVDAVNVLRDGGTFSYHAEPKWLEYFAGTRSHNTIEFDDRDQMPRLGRFLFGEWLDAHAVESLQEREAQATVGAGYTDWKGGRHHRRLALGESCMRVEDRLSGFARKAILRWRLMPDAWRVDGQTVTNGAHRLSVEATVPIVRFELLRGWESRYYMQKTEVSVLEVEFRQPGTITSEYRWS